MVYGLYAVKDNLVGYDRPVMFDNDGIAIRSFANGCKSPESFFAYNATDFSFWHIANFDNKSGMISFDDDLPKLIAHASDFLAGDLK